MVLGLATGRTMIPLYQRLIGIIRDQKLSLKRCRTFNLDEYVGLNPTDPSSYHYYMQEHFFRHVDLAPENSHFLDGCALDLDAEAKRYEELITSVGGIDLQLLGIGHSGHIGFNEPLSSLGSRTRPKFLSPQTRHQNRVDFGETTDDVPEQSLTMGVATILDAQEIILLATGSAKAEILAKAMEGPITSMITASALQTHANCKVIIDEDCAHSLTMRNYIEFVLERDPNWASYFLK